MSGQAAAGAKRERPEETEDGDWNLDERVFLVSRPVTPLEICQAVRIKMEHLLTLPILMEMAILNIPALRSLERGCRELWALTCRRNILPGATPARVRAAGDARQTWKETMIEYRAACRVAYAWSEAANQACVMLERRGLPAQAAGLIREYLHD